MRVLAFMPVYNEADILVVSVTRLAANGVLVHILDNWSTDGSWEIAQVLQARGVARAERIPADAPPRAYDLVGIRDRVAAIAAASTHDWCIWNDADEFIHPPTKHTLAEAIAVAAGDGFNAIEQLVALFPPIDNSFIPGTDFVAHFQHWRPQPQGGARPWVRIWRNTGAPLTFRGGNHEIDFDGRCIAPTPFILRHYPLRSQPHAERKVFHERRPRYSETERERGWHTHYDFMTATHSFLEDPSALRTLTDDAFAADLFTALGRHRSPP